MPLTALRIGENDYPIDLALQKAENGELSDWTYELLNALLAEQQDRGDTLSTTALTSKCFRSEYLKRRLDYTDDPHKLWAAFRGTMYHGRLEAYCHPRNIAEARYHVELDGLGSLSGSPDLVDPVRGVLYDFKTNKENPRYSKPWPEHVLQVQINRWLVDHAVTVDHEGISYLLVYNGDDPTVANEVLLNRMRFIPPKWHSLMLVYMDDKGPKLMTVKRSEEVIGKNGRPKNVNVPDVWSDQRVENVIRRLYAERKEALDSNTVPAIPDAFARQQHVLCGYCPVRTKCWDLEMEKGSE